MAAMKCIEILSPGLQTTVQDLGRFGFGHHGVPPSGALDGFSLRTANLLVGNPEGSACLETALMGLRFKTLTDLCIAVTGAELQPQVNKHPLKSWRSHVLKKGDVVSFLGPQSGCRAYVAFGGGIQMPEVLSSLSTNLASGFGGLKGRCLQKGDVLSIGSPRLHLAAAGRQPQPRWIPQYSNSWALRIVWGPQDNDFTQEAKRRFTESRYEVSPQSDRTGIRLMGPPIERKKDTAESIISEGLISGSIQVPGDGKPIIILTETVTGGYRKIAAIITADLPWLGQIKPGDKIRFAAVSLEAAHRAFEKMERKINSLKKKLNAS